MTTERFSVRRAVISRIALEEYILMFWWFILPVPLFGVLAVLFGNDLIRLIGFFALLWPLSLTARAWFATGKVGNLYEQGVTVQEDEEAIYFQPDDGKGVRLRRESIRQVVHRHGYTIMRLRRLGFLLVPEEGGAADRT